METGHYTTLSLRCYCFGFVFFILFCFCLFFERKLQQGAAKDT